MTRTTTAGTGAETWNFEAVCTPDLASKIAAEIMGLPWTHGGDEDEHCHRYGQLQELISAALAAAPAHPATGAGEGPTKAVLDVLAERKRQISVEGWTPEHDDAHDDRSIAKAAACYASFGAADDKARAAYSPGSVFTAWPWEARSWRPTTRRHDLVKAGALNLAEIERLDRLSARDVRDGYLTPPASREVSDAYHRALLQCGERYREMLLQSGTPTSEPIWLFTEEFLAGCRAPLPVPKLCRWLGYIQRTLVERGLTTIEAERDWTRPLFRPLDFPPEKDEASGAHGLSQDREG